jgi:hypothetical protein
MEPFKKDLAADNFEVELHYFYNGDQYKVRDNGSVLRYPRLGGRLRQYDNQWTFGIPNSIDGYLEIASVPIHGVVATAFHGPRPTEWHVVDHIDSDKYNNRPENLRWITNLENILLDPITAKRIARICGSVEAFLCEPLKFRDKLQVPKLDWIGNISEQEAQRVLQCLLALAGIDKCPSNGELDRWLVNRIEWLHYERAIRELPKYTMSKTANAVQCDWKVASEFSCCPEANDADPLSAYFDNLEPGLVFATNEKYTSFVMKFAMVSEKEALIVLTENPEGVNRWALAEVTFENDYFVHKSLGSFVTLEGAEKYYCLAQGLDWTGGDTFDDYIR